MVPKVLVAFVQTKPLSRAGSDSVGPYTFDRLGLSNASESGGQSLSRAMRVYSAYSAYSAPAGGR